MALNKAIMNETEPTIIVYENIIISESERDDDCFVIDINNRNIAIEVNQEEKNIKTESLLFIYFKNDFFIIAQETIYFNFWLSIKFRNF